MSTHSAVDYCEANTVPRERQLSRVRRTLLIARSHCPQQHYRVRDVHQEHIETNNSPDRTPKQVRRTTRDKVMRSVPVPRSNATFALLHRVTLSPITLRLLLVVSMDHTVYEDIMTHVSMPDDVRIGASIPPVHTAHNLQHPNLELRSRRKRYQEEEHGCAARCGLFSCPVVHPTKGY